jgi:hypothetical protein
MSAYHGSMQKGFYNHPLYQTWERMLRRCLDPNCTDYHRYGKKGIGVCDRWLFIENFIEDMGTKPHEDMTLDRVDNSKGYSPDNCRWATIKTQNRHRSDTKLNLEKVEEIKVLKASGLSYRKLGKMYGVDHGTIYAIFAGKSWRPDGQAQQSSNA